MEWTNNAIYEKGYESWFTLKPSAENGDEHRLIHFHILSPVTTCVRKSISRWHLSDKRHEEPAGLPYRLSRITPRQQIHRYRNTNKQSGYFSRSTHQHIDLAASSQIDVNLYTEHI